MWHPVFFPVKGWIY